MRSAFRWLLVCGLMASATGFVGSPAAAGPSVAAVRVVDGRAGTAAGNCETTVSGDLHTGSARCFDAGTKFYRVQLQVCAGTVGCETRFGPWKSMNSGQWSTRSDPFTWITAIGFQLGN